MSRPTAILLSFSIGLLMGAALLNHVWVESRGSQQSLILANYRAEQDLLYSRARRAGDPLAMTVHAINSAEADLGVGFRWLERENSSSYLEWSVYSWALLIAERELRKLTGSAEIQAKLEKGTLVVAADKLGRAAIALEKLELDDEARVRWLRAEKMASWTDPERRRDFIRKLERTENDALLEVLESAHLDTRTNEALMTALAQGRARLGVEPIKE